MRLRALAICTVIMLLLGLVFPHPSTIPNWALAETSEVTQQPAETPPPSNEPGPTQEPETNVPPEQTSTPEPTVVSEPTAAPETALPVEATPPVASEEPTPTITPEITPDPLENATEGYAAVLANESPVYEKANKDSNKLALLSKDDIIYISDRIFIDADNPEYDWLACHFDSEQGVMDGYVRFKQIRFFTEPETQTFLESMEQAEEYADFEGHPLKRVNCTFLDETPAAQPDPTVEPQITPSAEPTVEPPAEATVEPTVEPEKEPAPTLAPVTSITLDISEAAMAAGAKRTMLTKVEPSDAADSSIIWSSSDEAVALVDAAGNVTAISAGSAVITAAAGDSSGIFAQCFITVYPPITSLTVSGSNRMQAGKPYVLTALDNETPIASVLVAWSSSDETVATVDASGTVSGIMVGNAVITATVQGSFEWKFEFPVEIIRATVVTMTDSNKQFSMAVSQNISSMIAQEPAMSARSFSEFTLMRLLLKTDGTIPAVDEYNPDTIVGNKDNRYMIQFTSVAETEAAYNVLASAGYVKYVAPDSIMSITEQGKTQSSYSYHSWGAPAMNADTASESLAATTSGAIDVAVIDSGVSAHSFLSGKRLTAYDYVDADFDPSDQNGHGTHVAGTIVDLTQALNVRVKAFRVMDANGEGYTSNIVDAIYDAVDAGCDVINLSLGGGYSDYGYALYYNAISYATNRGVVVVCAAGNDASNTSYYVPARITLPGCIVTASLDSSLYYSYFSNFGTSVDVAAPGGGISSCNYTGGYTTKSGTSMAAPHISAACAMIALSHPSYSASQIESYLTSICTDLGPAGKDVDYGYGIPDLMALVPSTPIVRADLMPTTITFDSNVSIGKQIYFDSGIANNGDVNSGSFYVKWEVNGALMAYGLHSDVSANTTMMDDLSSFYWTPSSPGSYTVTFTADYNNTITEENETNNSVSVTVIVPADVYKPDLSPGAISYDILAVGETTYFTSSVNNLGDADSDSFAVRWTVNGVQENYSYHGGVSAHTIAMGSPWFFWTPVAPGSYTITLTLDCDNTITEEDESNNSVTVTVVVPEPISSYKPDLVPQYILYNPYGITAGKQITFDTSVANNGFADANSFAVKWEVNGEQMDCQDHPGIPAATTLWGSSQFNWTPPAPGYYTITFTADPNNNIDEGNESNNQSSVTVYADLPMPQSITISHPVIAISVGQGVNVLSATVLPAGSNQSVTWTSSNTNAATVSDTGYVYGTGVGFSLVRVRTVNGLYADCSVNVFKSGGVVGISLNKTNAAIDEGKTLKLTATLAPRSPAISGVKWSSSNPLVASVNSKGTVTGSIPGTAVITATASSGVQAQCTVTVNSLAVSQVNLSKTYLEVDEGKSTSTKASVLPKNARFKTVTWSSSDPSIATVSAAGKITTFKPGTVSITATAHNGVSSSCTLVVRSLAVSQVILSKTYLEVDEGKSTSLKASVLPKNARFKTVIWSSSDPSVATVSAAGKITTFKPGTVLITATAHNGVSSSCTLVVRSLAVSSIALTKAELTLNPGGTFTLKAALLPTNARYKVVTWVSSDPAVATVTASGKIKAVGSGTTIISAIAHNGLTASCMIIVP